MGNKKEATEKLAKANSQEKEACIKISVLRNNLEELRRKIKHQNRLNSVLSRDVERLQVSYQVADESDEDICSRKYSTPTSSSVRGKRKINEELEIDIYNFNMDCKETESNGASKTPATPINKSILKMNPTSNSFSRKSALANIVKNNTGNSNKSSKSNDYSKSSAKTRKAKGKSQPSNVTKKVETYMDNDVEEFNILSLSTSQE